MVRFLTLSLLLSVAAVCIDARPASAVSPNNPYRSFNLSGINYGSMQWEMKHGRQSNKAWSNGRASGRLFRGR